MPFEELKQRHAVVWSSGAYQGVTETIADIHRVAIERLDPQPGQRLLDLACGTGAVAELAAAAGADVVGVDIAPALIEQARERAAERGLAIDYRTGDAEALELEDASFDLVASTCGIMFAPDHQAVARELARVTKQGGRIALVCWTPESGLAQMFEVMRPFQPPSPPGVGNQFDWGREDYVRDLLADAFELAFDRGDSVLVAESGQSVWQLFSAEYGPTKTLADSLEEEKREELQRAFVDLHERSRTDGRIEFSRTYLLTVGTRK
ncbi:MAG TPA: methyltransferase domain-containing protein [Gaiellaceae bacterium]|nr:methyltransferase domain-containing protein [Gaiellaceae bacterium]